MRVAWGLWACSHDGASSFWGPRRFNDLDLLLNRSRLGGGLALDGNLPLDVASGRLPDTAVLGELPPLVATLAWCGDLSLPGMPEGDGQPRRFPSPGRVQGHGVVPGVIGAAGVTEDTTPRLEAYIRPSASASAADPVASPCPYPGTSPVAGHGGGREGRTGLRG